MREKEAREEPYQHELELLLFHCLDAHLAGVIHLRELDLDRRHVCQDVLLVDESTYVCEGHVKG